MTQFGKITQYDAKNGTGMIAPEQGGDALSFDRSGLQQQAQTPRSDQLYTYDTQQGPGGQLQAVNLQMEQGPNAREQTASENGNQGGFDQQGRSQAVHNLEGASRKGVDQARGDAENSGSQGGSVFQPLELDESKHERSAERQHELGRDPQGRDERSQIRPGASDRRS